MCRVWRHSLPIGRGWAGISRTRSCPILPWPLLWSSLDRDATAVWIGHRPGERSSIVFRGLDPIPSGEWRVKFGSGPASLLHWLRRRTLHGSDRTRRAWRPVRTSSENFLVRRKPKRRCGHVIEGTKVRDPAIVVKVRGLGCLAGSPLPGAADAAPESPDTMNRRRQRMIFVIPGAAGKPSSGSSSSVTGAGSYAHPTSAAPSAPSTPATKLTSGPSADKPALPLRPPPTSRRAPERRRRHPAPAQGLEAPPQSLESAEIRHRHGTSEQLPDHWPRFTRKHQKKASRKSSIRAGQAG